MRAQLPPRPKFEQVEAVASSSAEQRTVVLAAIGSMVFSWSNNESMFIYVLMLLMDTDEKTAAIVFSTLNTTRARIDLVARLAKIKIKDADLARELERIIKRFNECTRVRNDLIHCMFELNDAGEITRTHALRIQDTRGGISIGATRQMDSSRIQELTAVSRELKDINRVIWSFLPKLQAHLDGGSPSLAARNARG